MTREEAKEEIKNYNKNYPSGLSKECRDYIIKALEQEPTTAVVIPKGATNKDVFKAIFGYEPATDAVICNKEDWCGASEPCNYCISNPNNIGGEEKWWNAPYKGGQDK